MCKILFEFGLYKISKQRYTIISAYIWINYTKLGFFIKKNLRSTFVRSAWSFVFFIPSRHNGQWPPTLKDFYTRFYPLHICLILILEKEPVFPFSMLSAKQGNYWYHFITSLVWRGPWLGIGPGTYRARSQHYTTRLSRRRSLTGDWTQDLP